MQYKKQTAATLAIIITTATITQSDPLVYLKNDSKRLISVEPLMSGRTVSAEFIKPDDKYILDDGTKSLDGLRIQYCPSSYVGVGCNEDPEKFKEFAKTTEYKFTTSAKKYYVKLTIDSNNNVSLKPQEGVLGGTRTSNLKYSLSGNITTEAIKKEEIKNAPLPPQQQAASEKKLRSTQPQSSASAQVVVPSVAESNPAVPLVEQAAPIKKNLFVATRLQELQKKLEKIRENTLEKNIGRMLFEFIERSLEDASKKNAELKDEIGSAHYQLTQDEEILAQQVDELFINLEKRVTKLREFLKISTSNVTFKKAPIHDITAEERQKVLQGIKELAPALYGLIIKVDPTGQDHINRLGGVGGMVTPSEVTGLPIISVDKDVMSWPDGVLLFTLGHELAHYVSAHSFEIHHYDYPSENLLQMARYRLKETECDKKAILDFGVSIEDGITTIEYWMDAQDEASEQKPHEKTFRRTHPLGFDRIKNLKALGQEVEWKKEHKSEPIDWEKLVQENKKATGLQEVDPALVQAYVNKTYTQADFERYTKTIMNKYKNQGELNYFVQPDKDKKGKPWTKESIKEFLVFAREDLDDVIKKRTFGPKSEDTFVSDVLHFYYNAKILEVAFQDNSEIKTVIKNALEAFLNRQIERTSIINIIQKFEK